MRRCGRLWLRIKARRLFPLSPRNTNVQSLCNLYSPPLFLPKISLFSPLQFLWKSFAFLFTHLIMQSTIEMIFQFMIWGIVLPTGTQIT